jgi:hypothetical protein
MHIITSPRRKENSSLFSTVQPAKTAQKMNSKNKKGGYIYKKIKRGAGRGESPDANWNLLKKSRVNIYIFFYTILNGIIQIIT